MSKWKIFLVVIGSFLLLTATAMAQYTTVTGTFQDPNGQTFNNGTYTITFVPVAGQQGPYTYNGVAINQGPYSGSLNSSGAINLVSTIYDNKLVAPSGSQWAVTVCPNASFRCTTVALVITGTTQNVATTVNASIPAISINANLFWPIAYADAEITNPSTGIAYFNTTSNAGRLYYGGAWNAFGGGSGTTVNNITCTTHQWLSSFTAPNLACSQINFSDLAGGIAVSQMNNGTGASSSTYWRGDGTWATPPGTGNTTSSGMVNGNFPEATGANSLGDSGVPVNSIGHFTNVGTAGIEAQDTSTPPNITAIAAVGTKCYPYQGSGGTGCDSGGSSFAQVFTYMGVCQAGVASFAVNLPTSNAPTYIPCTSTTQTAELQFAANTTQSIMLKVPWLTGHGTTINFSMTSRSAQTTGSATITPTYACIVGGSVPDNPTYGAIIGLSSFTFTPAGTTLQDVFTTASGTVSCTPPAIMMVNFSVATTTSLLMNLSELQVW